MKFSEPHSQNTIQAREVLVCLRKITQAIDLYSRKLVKDFGLTGPQLVILEEVIGQSGISVGELGNAISLSQATVTSILTRLEKRGLITRTRSEKDKRRVEIKATDQCRGLLEKAPPPLQETFLKAFVSLEQWEQSMILSSLQRVVSMMQAKTIDASPFLATGPINFDPDCPEKDHSFS